MMPVISAMTASMAITTGGAMMVAEDIIRREHAGAVITGVTIIIVRFTTDGMLYRSAFCRTVHPIMNIMNNSLRYADSRRVKPTSPIPAIFFSTLHRHRSIIQYGTGVCPCREYGCEMHYVICTG